jgi:hypothetical protein
MTAFIIQLPSFVLPLNSRCHPTCKTPPRNGSKLATRCFHPKGQVAAANTGCHVANMRKSEPVPALRCCAAQVTRCHLQNLGAPYTTTGCKVVCWEGASLCCKAAVVKEAPGAALYGRASGRALRIADRSSAAAAGYSGSAACTTTQLFSILHPQSLVRVMDSGGKLCTCTAARWLNACAASTLCWAVGRAWDVAACWRSTHIQGWTECRVHELELWHESDAC